MTPTTISGNIDWVGLDDTKIRAISDQSGVFNGEYWHGTFFQELPELLYQAVARPFVKYLLHSSIEDFVMPVPYQEEIWRTSKYSDIFGKFILSSEFFQLIEKNGEFKFGRDSFYLGEYIFVTNELLLNNKKCEIDLITSEILNCVLGAYNEESSDSFFEQAWKRYLLTQAHDSYAVPYIRNGDYSEVQLSAEEFQKLELNPEKISISQLSIKVQKEIQKECNDFIFNSLTKIAKHLGNTSNNKNSNIVNFLVFNPTARLRKNVISIPVHLENPSEMIIEGKNGEIVDFSYQNSTIKFIPEVPSIGYALYSLVRKNNKVSMTSEAFFYDIHISTDNKTLEIMYRETKVFELSFESKTDFHFELKAESQDAVENVSVFHDKTNISGFNLEIIQYRGVNRLEFKLDTNALNRVVVLPEIKVSETLINYPFGMEETKRTQIQTLDFLWLKGIEKGILFMQKNSQKFSIDRESLAIKNHLAGNGGFEFAMAITSTNSLNSPYHHINDYYFKLFGIKVDNIDDSIDRARSFLTIEQPISLVNMWRRTNNSYLRIFNPTNDLSMVNINGPLIKEHLIEVDFNGNEMEVLKKERFNINPWKIQTLKI